jgi:hypothetical protein
VSVLFDSWYGAWHCHEAPTFSVPICLSPLLDFLTKTYEDAAVQVTHLSSMIFLETHCTVASMWAAAGQPGLTPFSALDSTVEGNHSLEESTMARCCFATDCLQATVNANMPSFHRNHVVQHCS